MLARLIIITAVIATYAFGAEESIRESKPKSCFLFSWGKGPNWKTDIGIEFQRHHLNLKRPYVDDRFSDPTPKALTWVDRTVAPSVSEIARVDGRVVLRADYPVDGKFGRKIECVMLAIETAPDSDWFAPFFVAQPELFHGQFVSSDSVRIGYVASLQFSGTGAMRTRHLFDLTANHPALVESATAGRVRKVDYDDEQAYEKALKTFEHEARILNGDQGGARQPTNAPDSDSEGNENPKQKSKGRSQ